MMVLQLTRETMLIEMEVTMLPIMTFLQPITQQLTSLLIGLFRLFLITRYKTTPYSARLEVPILFPALVLLSKEMIGALIYLMILGKLSTMKENISSAKKIVLTIT